MAPGMRYTVQQFEKAIPNSGGLWNVIARKVGCDYHTAKNRISANPKLMQLYIAERETIGDVAESNIISSIQGGNIDDSWRWLKTQRRKEFGDNIDVTTGGERLKLIWPEDAAHE